MEADGSGVTNLTNNAAQDFSPFWIPDGSGIAFSSDRDGVYAVYVVNPDGSEPARLLFSGFEGGTFLGEGLAFSSDGHLVAYAQSEDIYVANADGTGVRNVSNSPDVRDYPPVWSPDGSRLAFPAHSLGDEVNGTQNIHIVVVNADGSGLTSITSTSTGLGQALSWSPDGTRITVTSSRAGREMAIYVVHPDGTGFTKLSDDAYAPAWSPDGSLIAFVSDRDGSNELYVMSADGSNQARLTHFGKESHRFFFSGPIWSPLPEGELER